MKKELGYSTVGVFKDRTGLLIMKTLNREAAERAARKIAVRIGEARTGDNLPVAVLALLRTWHAATEADVTEIIAEIITAELDGPACLKCGHNIENVDQEGMCHTAVWPEGNAPRTCGYPCGCHCEFPETRARLRVA